MSIKKFVIDNLGDTGFVAVSNLVHRLPGKEFIQIRREGDHWVVDRGNGIELHSPSPKFFGVSIESFSKKFENFVKIEEGDVCVDVGACLGDTTVIMAKKTGDTGFVVAVEPEPINLSYLETNLLPYRNSEVLEFAAWNKKQDITLNVNKSYVTGHSLVWNDEGGVTVEGDTLDNITRKFPIIDFVKIDVQGAEEQVLEGAKKLMSRCRKIVVESHFFDPSGKDVSTYPMIQRKLDEAGYETRVWDQRIVSGRKK